MPLPHLLLRRLAPALLALFVLSSTIAAPASATPQTILRGLANVVLAPLDAVLAPVSTGIGIYENLQNIDDSPGVRMFYPLPAFFYATGLQLGGAWIRLTTGLMETGVGLLVLPLETDIEPMFSVVDDATALVEIDIDYMDYPLRFGVNYTNPGF